MHNIASFAQQSNPTGAPDSSCPSVMRYAFSRKRKCSVLLCYAWENNQFGKYSYLLCTRGKITNLVNIPTFYVPSISFNCGSFKWWSQIKHTQTFFFFFFLGGLNCKVDSLRLCLDSAKTNVLRLAFFLFFFFLHAFEGLVATVHALCMNRSHKVWLFSLFSAN